MVFIKENTKFLGEGWVPELDRLETKIWDIAHPEFLEGRTKAWRYWVDKVEYIYRNIISCCLNC